MIIKVTQEHIDKGIPEDTMACPIALALYDAGFKGYDVDIITATDKACAKRLDSKEIILPNICRDFILDFDHGGLVQPFEFEFTVPET